MNIKIDLILIPVHFLFISKCYVHNCIIWLINVHNRCPTYLNLPAECTFVTDPNDSCCQKPTCPNPNTPIVPTFGQSNIGHGIVQPPSSTDLYQNYSPIPYTVIYNTGPTTHSPSATNHASIGKWPIETHLTPWKSLLSQNENIKYNIW